MISTRNFELLLVILAVFCATFMNCQNFYYISQVEAGDRHFNSLKFRHNVYYNSASLKSGMQSSSLPITITLTTLVLLTRQLFDK